MQVKIAQTNEEIAGCFPVITQLRPHLVAEEFVDRVRRMQRSGYLLAYLIATERGKERVKAVAGYRLLDQLLRGNVLYVDDLVTDEASRSQGYGDHLFDWLLAEARRQNCGFLELDSGVHRGDAHRFYFRKRMKIACYHFFIPVE
ncbi:MAG: GNAT family N-acetyltransferase [Capsulimonadales bacterium]|nr:GNAT family N-acetyltransferase [Capsulimonadales bacterium]